MATKYRLLCLLGLSLSACAHAPVPPPTPLVETVKVSVPVPTPCKALAQLGPEPIYADTDEAIKAAEDIFTLAKLYAKGRLQRIGRLASYTAAKASCAVGD